LYEFNSHTPEEKYAEDETIHKGLLDLKESYVLIEVGYLLKDEKGLCCQEEDYID